MTLDDHLRLYLLIMVNRLWDHLMNLWLLEWWILFVDIVIKGFVNFVVYLSQIPRKVLYASLTSLFSDLV